LCGFGFKTHSLLYDLCQWDDRKERTSEGKTTGSGRKKKAKKEENKKVPRLK